MEGADQRYAGAAAEYGPALERLARAYEADPAERRDLLQDIHLALWRSLALFDGRCSMRTWVYRVAHNTAASHVAARRRTKTTTLASLDELAEASDGNNPEQTASEHQMLERLTAMIRGLKAPDAQVMLLYLEDLDAAAIGEITGLSAGAVATKVHRLKTLLAKRFREDGGRNG
ncbi:MAG: sigma-70 family RNA polymerase sigma factor [Alphaproteobacteria bacterium]|nr:sigma-70 family RNA polymerase sigma factor [Alphaproteobacteria bacterium]